MCEKSFMSKTQTILLFIFNFLHMEAYTCHNNKLFKETMLHPRGNLYRFAVQGYILQVAQSLGFDLEVKSF